MHLNRVCLSIPLGSMIISFKSEKNSTSDSSELRASCFPFDLLGMALGPTMFEVTSGYSTSENNFFLRDHHLLNEFEFEVFDNQLKLDVLVI